MNSSNVDRGRHLKEGLDALRKAHGDVDRTLAAFQEAMQHFSYLSDPASKRDVRVCQRAIVALEKLKARLHQGAQFTSVKREDTDGNHSSA